MEDRHHLTFSVGKDVHERRQFHDRPAVDKSRVRVNVNLSNPDFHPDFIGISRKLLKLGG